jgi:hypothetical protein
MVQALVISYYQFRLCNAANPNIKTGGDREMGRRYVIQQVLGKF